MAQRIIDGDHCVVVIPGAPSQATNELGVRLSRMGGVPVVGPEGSAWAFFDQSAHAEMLLGGATALETMPGMQTFTGRVVPCSAEHPLPVVMLCDEEGVNVTQGDRRPGMPLLPSKYVSYATWVVPLLPEEVMSVIRGHQAARGWLREVETFDAIALVDGNLLLPHAEALAGQVLVGDPDRAECVHFRQYLACLFDGADAPLADPSEWWTDRFEDYLHGPYRPIMPPDTEPNWRGTLIRALLYTVDAEPLPKTAYREKAGRYSLVMPEERDLVFEATPRGCYGEWQSAVLWLNRKALVANNVTVADLKSAAPGKTLTYGTVSSHCAATTSSLQRTEDLLHFLYGGDIVRVDFGPEITLTDFE